MTTQNHIERIKEWYSQSLHEQFNPFIKLWISFNGWYKAKYNIKNDREGINLCKRDPDLQIFYQRSFSDRHFCDSLNELGLELDKNPLVNLTRPKDKKLRLSRLEDENGEISYLDNSSEAFGTYLEVIYRVRCNLFHCEKSPANDRDKLIVECSFKTLSEIMSQIIRTIGSE